MIKISNSSSIDKSALIFVNYLPMMQMFTFADFECDINHYDDNFLDIDE